MHSITRVFSISLTISIALLSSPSFAANEVQSEPKVAYVPVAPILPPSFFSEPWKQPPEPGQRPASQEAVSNAALELSLYGYDAKNIQLSGDVNTPGRPLNLWTGSTKSAIAISLRDKNRYADLSGLAKVSLTTRVSGFHKVRPVIKLSDGNWYIGDIAIGDWTGYNVHEISFADVRWVSLDIENIVTKGRWVEGLDLTKVDEIGFADLIRGSGHGPGGWVNIGHFEVFANSVER